MRLTFTVPVKATSSLNARLHWRVRARKVKAERQTTALGWRTMGEASRQWRWMALSGKSLVITLTRIGPRKLDSDNVQGALKAVRDEVAAQLGIDDGDERLRWEYAQERGEYAVRVEIVTAEREAA